MAANPSLLAQSASVASRKSGLCASHSSITFSCCGRRCEVAPLCRASFASNKTASKHSATSDEIDNFKTISKDPRDVIILFLILYFFKTIPSAKHQHRDHKKKQPSFHFARPP